MVGGNWKVDRNKGEKKWEKCNNIINKIYLKYLKIKNAQRKNLINLK